MTTETREKRNIIMAQAGRDIKGNYQIYHSYRRMLEDLELTSKEFERAVKQLANILKV